MTAVREVCKLQAPAESKAERGCTQEFLTHNAELTVTIVRASISLATFRRKIPGLTGVFS